MSAIDSHIDDLYQQALADFTASRNALAKTLSGDERKRVSALTKPTVVPWAVNQVYWRARPTYSALLKSGERLRKAQLAALEGKSADVRAATEAHRAAIADAVRAAERLASAEGSKPAPDALMRTFEALSLAMEPPETPGRLTRELQPAGFEALAGVTPVPLARPTRVHAKLAPPPAPDDTRTAAAKVKIAAAVQKREAAQRRKDEAERRRREAAQKKHAAAIKKAEAAVDRARRQMEEAETALRTLRDKAL